KPASSLESAVLPHPEGPIITVRLRLGSVKSQPSMTDLLLLPVRYALHSPRTTTSPAAVAVAAVVAVLTRSPRLQPRCDVPPQLAQSFAGRQPRHADRDHPHHDHLVGASHVGVPDQKTQPAPAGLTA